MKVKVLLNLGHRDFPDNALPAGEHEVSDKFGAELIRRGLATEVFKATPAKAAPQSRATMHGDSEAVVVSTTTVTVTDGPKDDDARQPRKGADKQQTKPHKE